MFHEIVLRTRIQPNAHSPPAPLQATNTAFDKISEHYSPLYFSLGLRACTVSFHYTFRPKTPKVTLVRGSPSVAHHITVVSLSTRHQRLLRAPLQTCRFRSSSYLSSAMR